jgi:hypothetical protein
MSQKGRFFMVGIESFYQNKIFSHTMKKKETDTNPSTAHFFSLSSTS